MTRKKKRRLLALVVGLTLLGAATALVLAAFNENLVFFYGPSELATKKIGPDRRIRIGGPAIATSMLLPLLIMAAGFMLLFAWLLLLRMRTILNERKAEALRLYGQPAPRRQRADAVAAPS